MSKSKPTPKHNRKNRPPIRRVRKLTSSIVDGSQQTLFDHREMTNLKPSASKPATRKPATSKAANDSTSPRPSDQPPVLAAYAWRNNAELIADVHRLGYIPDDAACADVTYGRGLWWSRYRPQSLVTHDRYTVDGVSFTDLPEPDNTFDVVAFDPPYIAMGGRTTSTLPDFCDRFGLTSAPRTPAALQALIDAGLAEVHRVLRPKGTALVKCQDYVSGGQLWPGTLKVQEQAQALGFEIVDRFEHLATHPRPQPGGRVQRHARRNLSTLLVFRKRRRAS